MGNAPLACPPMPTDSRVVIPVSTKRRVGIRLFVFPPVQQQSNSTTPAATLYHTRIRPSRTSLPPPERTALDYSHQLYSLAPQLESTEITPEEYKDKLVQLQERLAEYKGGFATLAIGLLSLGLVVAFIGAYLTPAFWSSALFKTPVYICCMAAAILAIFTILIRYSRRQTQRLLESVEELYRPWRGQGIHVTMKHVATVGNVYYCDERNNTRIRQGYASRNNCFCIVMNIVRDEEEAATRGGDHFSVGTVMTDGSDE